MSVTDEELDEWERILRAPNGVQYGLSIAEQRRLLAAYREVCEWLGDA